MKERQTEGKVKERSLWVGPLGSLAPARFDLDMPVGSASQALPAAAQHTAVESAVCLQQFYFFISVGSGAIAGSEVGVSPPVAMSTPTVESVAAVSLSPFSIALAMAKPFLVSRSLDQRVGLQALPRNEPCGMHVASKPPLVEAIVIS